MSSTLETSNLLILAFLSIILMTIPIETKTEKKLKYEICLNDSPPIDSSARLLDTNLVYLIADDMAYKLQIISQDKVKIEEHHFIYHWNQQIEAPIDIISANEYETKLIYLQNCEKGTRWTVNYEEGLYKDSNQMECIGKSFESVTGKKQSEIRYTPYLLEYFKEGNEIRDRNSLQLFRSNESSAKPIKFIKFVYDTNELELLNTYPFTELNGQKITAAFIYDYHWYLFGGRYYCRVKLNDLTFEECKPILINDWISNCDEEEEPGKLNGETKKGSGFSPLLIILMIIIFVAIVVLIIIFIFIFKEVSKKSTSSTPSSAPSSH